MTQLKALTELKTLFEKRESHQLIEILPAWVGSSSLSPATHKGQKRRVDGAIPTLSTLIVSPIAMALLQNDAMSNGCTLGETAFVLVRSLYSLPIIISARVQCNAMRTTRSSLSSRENGLLHGTHLLSLSFNWHDRVSIRMCSLV